MRIALHQFAPQFPGREKNWEYVRRTAELIDADIVVFPELSSCGYMYSSRSEIKPYTDLRTALDVLRPVARQYKRLIVGGFAEISGHDIYNSAFVVGPDRTWVYRKIHLWNVENSIFRPGNQALTFKYRGHRLGVIVCYDLQFPELASYYARQGTELLIVPMSWAEEPVAIGSPLQVYNHLAISTAFSHGIYVGVANRIGEERGAVFRGQSSLTDPFGSILSLGSEEGTLVTEVDFALPPTAKRPNPNNDLDTDPHLRVSFPRAIRTPPQQMRKSRRGRSARRSGKTSRR